MSNSDSVSEKLRNFVPRYENDENEYEQNRREGNMVACPYPCRPCGRLFPFLQG